MNQHPNGIPQHLLDFIKSHDLDISFVAPGVPMPSVPLAARAIGVPEDQILKTLLFAGAECEFVVAIAHGTRRIDRNRLARAAAMRVSRPAKAADVIAITGSPAGGVAPLALPVAIPVIVDSGTAALRFAYGGGGQEHLLLRVRMADVIRCNNALVADITERPAEPPR